MADFVKKDWVCGEVITADELNRLEGGVEEALDKGYECIGGYTLLTEETVTTVAEYGGVVATLAYGEPIDADTLKVTFDEQEYTCPVKVVQTPSGDSYAYGAPYNIETGSIDWSEYPFSIVSGVTQASVPLTQIYTETAGTYNVKIEAYDESVATTDCFKKAVQSVAIAFIVKDASAIGEGQLDKTYTEIEEAYLSGRQVIVKKNDSYDTVCGVGYDGASHFVETKRVTYSTTTPSGYPSYGGIA